MTWIGLPTGMVRIPKAAANFSLWYLSVRSFSSSSTSRRTNFIEETYPSPSFLDLVLLRSLFSLFLWMGTIQLRTYESCFVLQTNYIQVLSVNQHPSSLISSHQHRPICPKLHIDWKEDIHSWVLRSHLKKHLSSLLAQFSIAMNPACTKQSSLRSSTWLKRHVSP